MTRSKRRNENGKRRRTRRKDRHGGVDPAPSKPIEGANRKSSTEKILDNLEQLKKNIKVYEENRDEILDNNFTFLPDSSGNFNTTQISTKFDPPLVFKNDAPLPNESGQMQILLKQNNIIFSGDTFEKFRFTVSKMNAMSKMAQQTQTFTKLMRARIKLIAISAFKQSGKRWHKRSAQEREAEALRRLTKRKSQLGGKKIWDAIQHDWADDENDKLQTDLGVITKMVKTVRYQRNFNLQVQALILSLFNKVTFEDFVEGKDMVKNPYNEQKSATFVISDKNKKILLELYKGGGDETEVMVTSEYPTGVRGKQRALAPATNFWDIYATKFPIVNKVPLALGIKNTIYKEIPSTQLKKCAIKDDECTRRWMLDERAGGARELTAALQLAVGNASKPLEGAESTTRINRLTEDEVRQLGKHFNKWFTYSFASGGDFWEITQKLWTKTQGDTKSFDRGKQRHITVVDLKMAINSVWRKIVETKGEGAGYGVRIDFKLGGAVERYQEYPWAPGTEVVSNICLGGIIHSLKSDGVDALKKALRNAGEEEAVNMMGENKDKVEKAAKEWTDAINKKGGAGGIQMGIKFIPAKSGEASTAMAQLGAAWIFLHKIKKLIEGQSWTEDFYFDCDDWEKYFAAKGTSEEWAQIKMYWGENIGKGDNETATTLIWPVCAEWEELSDNYDTIIDKMLQKERQGEGKKEDFHAAKDAFFKTLLDKPVGVPAKKAAAAARAARADADETQRGFSLVQTEVGAQAKKDAATAEAAAMAEKQALIGNIQMRTPKKNINPVTYKRLNDGDTEACFSCRKVKTAPVAAAERTALEGDLAAARGGEFAEEPPDASLRALAVPALPTPEILYYQLRIGKCGIPDAYAATLLPERTEIIPVQTRLDMQGAAIDKLKKINTVWSVGKAVLGVAGTISQLMGGRGLLNAEGSLGAYHSHLKCGGRNCDFWNGLAHNLGQSAREAVGFHTTDGAVISGDWEAQQLYNMQSQLRNAGVTEAQQLFMNMVEGWIWTEADKKSFKLRQRDGNKWKQEQALIVCRLKMYVQNLFCLNVQIALMTKLANCFTKKGNIVLNYPELLKLQRLVGDGENSMMAYEIKNPKKTRIAELGGTAATARAIQQTDDEEPVCVGAESPAGVRFIGVLIDLLKTSHTLMQKDILVSRNLSEYQEILFKHFWSDGYKIQNSKKAVNADTPCGEYARQMKKVYEEIRKICEKNGHEWESLVSDFATNNMNVTPIPLFHKCIILGEASPAAEGAKGGDDDADAQAAALTARAEDANKVGNLVDEAAWKLSQYVKNLKPWEGINKYHEVMRTRLLHCDTLGQDGVSKIERIPKLTATSAPTELAENVRKINEIILDVIKNPSINNFMNFRYQAPCKNNADEKSASTLFGSLLQTIAKQLLTKSKIASELKRDLKDFFKSCCQELRTKRISGVDDAEAHVTKFVHQADRFLLHEYQERAPVIYKKLQDWIDTPFSKYMSILGWEASAAWGSKAFSELWKNELVLAPTEEKDRTVRYLCEPAAAGAAERVRNDKICFWPTKKYNMKHGREWGAIRNFYNAPLRSGGRFFKGCSRAPPPKI